MGAAVLTKTDAIEDIIDRANRSNVARETGLTLSAISRILNGFREPTSDNLEKVARALGLSMDDLHAYLRQLRDKHKRSHRRG